MRDIGQGQSFIDFTLRNRIYIDKTEQISNLLKRDRVFLSRPRRFGKSLLLDTIGELFENGVEPYFKGTWIYDKWTERKYPVLRLNFLNFSYTDYRDFCTDFDECLMEFANLNGFEYVSKDSPLRSMRSLLNSLRPKKSRIVILIDEYDAPLTVNINNPEIYERYRIALRGMYGVMKGNAGIRFLGITGVTRLKDVSIFSVGSDILDMSYAADVSTIIGFTREEIRNYYVDYLNLAVSVDSGIPRELVTQEQRENLLDRISEEYNGYCFDEFYQNKVYSTWSVNSFFQNISRKGRVIFGDYWYDNGGMPSVLAECLETHTIGLENYAEDIKVDSNDFLNPTSLLSMKQNVLMCQTGYLTAHSPVPDGGTVTLGIPNMEVRRSLTGLLSKRIFSGADFSKSGNESFFSEASPEKIVERLNTLMNTINYENYP